MTTPASSLHAFVLVSVAVLCGAVVAGAASSGLAAHERRLVRFIEAHEREGRALLERAVNINSGTHELRRRARGGRAVPRASSTRSASTTRWVDGAAFGRAGHLIAEPAGAPRAASVLLIGHLDTVFEPDSPFQRFERARATARRGPGIIDMKGGDVIMLQALAALRAAGALDRMSVTVVLTGDEEDSGAPLELARRDADRGRARAPTSPLGFEDGDGDPSTPSSRGAASSGVDAARRPARRRTRRRSSATDVGAGAIYEAARILDALPRASSPASPT